MFIGCSSLKELDLSNFNTKKVTKMESMFKQCSSMEEINVSSFTIKRGTLVNEMFIDFSFELKKKVRAQLKKISEKAFH